MEISSFWQSRHNEKCSLALLLTQQPAGVRCEAHVYYLTPTFKIILTEKQDKIACVT
jgi:hypothetical protein